MTTAAGALPIAVSDALRRYARHAALVGILTALGFAIAATLAFFIVGSLIDRWLDIAPTIRVIAPFSIVIVWLITVARIVATLISSGNRLRAAAALDRLLPGSRDLFRSTIDFLGRGYDATAPVHPFMLEKTIAGAQTLACGVSPRTLVGWKLAPKAWLAALVLIGIVAALWLVPAMRMDLLLRRFVNPFGNYPRPSLTLIDVDAPLLVRVSEGDDFTVAAKLSGRVDAEPRAELRLTDLAGRTTQSLPMTPRPGNRFELTLRALAAPKTFVIISGDGRTATYTIQVTPRPSITKFVAHYTYPGYTRLPKKEEEIRFSEIRGVEGTRVRVELEASMPIAEGTAAFPESKLGIHWDRTGTKGSFNFVINRETPFNVTLRSESGEDNRTGAPYRVRVIPDNPPTISLLNVPEALTFYRDDVFRINFRGTDDFGINEVYLRARGGKGLTMSGNNVTEIAVPFSPPGAKEVNGELTLELRDITDDAATGVELELVMVDTKGQEAAAPRLQLTVLSDTIDRLLADLLEHQDRFLATLRASTTSLQTSAGRIGVLVEGMDDSTKIEGKRLEMVDQISRDLAAVGVPYVAADLSAYRVFGYSEFPERAGRQTIAVFSDGLLIRHGSSYAPFFKQIKDSPSPKQTLLALKALLDKEQQQAASLTAALGDLATQTRLEWVQAAVDQAIEVEMGLTKASSGREARAMIRQKQDARLAEIAKVVGDLKARLEALNEAELVAAINAFTAALAMPREERDKGLPAALKEIQTKLAVSGAMTGKLGQSLQMHEKTYPLVAALGTPQDAASVHRAILALGTRLRLRRLYPGATPAELLPIARMYESARTTNPEVIANAAAWSQASLPWQASYDAVNRVMNLRASLRDTQVAVGTGKLTLESVRFDRAWQQAREWVVSLAKDSEGGVFDAADPAVREEIKKITTRRAIFEPTVAAEALRRDPTLMQRINETLVQCDASIAALWPRVEPGVRETASQWPALLRDLSTNLAGDAKLFEEEISQITTEAAAAGPRAEIKRGERTRGGQSRPERMIFAISNNDRIIAHGVALAAALDARELQWVFTADQPTADELANASILQLLLAHLDQETYDKTVATYIAQVYGHKPYPAFIEEIGRYYGELGARMREASAWAAAMSAGKTAELATNEAYQRVPAQINKMPRLFETKRSLARQVEFIKAYDAAKDAPTRRAMLTAMLGDPGTAPIVWERIYLALRGVVDFTDAASAQNGKPWTGVTPQSQQSATAAAQFAASLLPPQQPTPEEVRPVADLLVSLAPMLTKSASDKVGAMPESERGAAREDLARWTGEALGVLRDLESKTAIAQAVVRPPARVTGRIRADLDRVETRLVRNEMNWSLRAAAAIQRSWSARADALLPTTDPASGRRWESWVTAGEGLTRRRSAAAAAQRSRGLGLDSGGPEAQFLKMPKHLYEELQRGAAKPYPEQFKDTALKYMDGIVKDSR